MGEPRSQGQCERQGSSPQKEPVTPTIPAQTENISKLKLQLELSVNDEREELIKDGKMSGKLFSTTESSISGADNGSFQSNNNNNSAQQSNLPRAGPGATVGPDMTSTPSSEHEPRSFGGESSISVGGSNPSGQHSGINLHLDLRRCTDVTISGHPLQRVTTPSPVPTPTQGFAWNEVPLSRGKAGGGGAQSCSSDKGSEEDYCQCHLKEQQQQPAKAKKLPHIFTTQESVHEPTAGLRQYPNGQRYLCKSCRTEVMADQDKCPSCPHFDAHSPFSSLEGSDITNDRRHFPSMPPVTMSVQQGCSAGIMPRETVINMPQHHCDMQNRDNEQMVSYYHDSYDRHKGREGKCRWLKKPHILIPVCMLLCALLAVGVFYLLTERKSEPTFVPYKDGNGTDQEVSSPLITALQQQGFCVKCVYLKLSADRKDDFTRTLQKVPNPDDIDNENEMLCCAQDSAQQQQIMEAMFETINRRSQSYPAFVQPRNTTSSKNNLAALLYLGPVKPPEASKTSDESTESRKAPKRARARSSQSSEAQADTSTEAEDSDMPHIDSAEIVYGWTNSTRSGAGFVRPGVFFDESRGRLTVRRNGLYQVYTKISFRPQINGPNRGVIFTQKIVKENSNSRNRGPVELLKDTQFSPCPDVSTTHACHSSSLSAVVYLKQGDEIYVEASHRDLILRDKGSCYFGIFYVD